MLSPPILTALLLILNSTPNTAHPKHPIRHVHRIHYMHRNNLTPISDSPPLLPRSNPLGSVSFTEAKTKTTTHTETLVFTNFEAAKVCKQTIKPINRYHMNGDGQCRFFARPDCKEDSFIINGNGYGAPKDPASEGDVSQKKTCKPGVAYKCWAAPPDDPIGRPIQKVKSQGKRFDG